MLTLPLLIKRHTHSWLLFKWSVFPWSPWVMPAPHHIFLRKPLRIAESRFLQAPFLSPSHRCQITVGKCQERTCLGYYL